MKLWKKREHLRKIDLKKTCGRPREDFSRHPHFRKQEYYFFGLRTVLFQNFKDVGNSHREMLSRKKLIDYSNISMGDMSHTK